MYIVYSELWIYEQVLPDLLSIYSSLNKCNYIPLKDLFVNISPRSKVDYWLCKNKIT